MKLRVIRLLTMVVISLVVTVSFTFGDVELDKKDIGDSEQTFTEGTLSQEHMDMAASNYEAASAGLEFKDFDEDAAVEVEQPLQEGTLSADQKAILASTYKAAKEAMTAKKTKWDSSNKFIGIAKPKNNSAFYFTKSKREKVKTKVKVRDTWYSYYTMPVLFIYDVKKGDLLDDYYYGSIAPLSGYATTTGKIKFPKKAGKYELWAVAMPCYADGTWVDAENIPLAWVKVKIRKLKPPTKIKAKAGKKKVTITFKKAKGAKKTVIYRSTSEYGKYKKIGTTTGSKYVDKGVKKGKHFFYQLRTTRPKTKLKSGFSDPVRSKKVK